MRLPTTVAQRPWTVAGRCLINCCGDQTFTIIGPHDPMFNNALLCLDPASPCSPGWQSPDGLAGDGGASAEASGYLPDSGGHPRRDGFAGLRASSSLATAGQSGLTTCYVYQPHNVISYFFLCLRLPLAALHPPLSPLHPLHLISCLLWYFRSFEGCV